MTHARVRSFLAIAIFAATAALWSSAALAQTPTNACSAAPLVAVPGVYSGSTTSSTNDGSADCGMSATSRDVWLRFTAPSNASFVASTCGGASWDTVLSVHTGCPGTSANQIGCLDDSCGQQTQLSVPVSAATTYYIRIAGFNNAAGSFTLNLSYAVAPNPGPDVIVGDLSNIARWGAVGGITAYSIGTTSCNIGTSDVLWVRDTNQHPVIAQSMYRLLNGRFEHIGQSWLKHTFGTIDNGICGTCNGHLGQILGVGCSDPYVASQAGDISLLGPKWQVNVTTGSFTYPFYNNPPAAPTIGRRIQVATGDIDPATNPDALYFFEAAYITGDDALAGNGLNNYSTRRTTVSSRTATPTYSGGTIREHPAIKSWKDADPGVTEVNADYVEANLTARFIVSAKATDNANGTWTYEYAVFNLNANRSGRAFSVPVPAGVVVTNPGFHDVAYHSGDGIAGVSFDGTDWPAATSSGQITWATQPITENASANALRWGTLYNFRFTASAPPMTGNAAIELFKPGVPGEANSVAVIGIPIPGCPADWNHNGIINSQDFFEFIADLFNENADFNHDGETSSQDFFDFVTAFFAGC